MTPSHVHVCSNCGRLGLLEDFAHLDEFEEDWQCERAGLIFHHCWDWLVEVDVTRAGFAVLSVLALQILDAHYPEGVFRESSSDEGPQLVATLRRLLRAQVPPQIDDEEIT